MRGYSSPFFSIYSDTICNALFTLQPFLHIIFIPLLLNGTDHFHLKSIIPLKKIITSCLMVSEAGLLLDRTALLRYNPIFDSQIYQNTAESLILPGFFSGAFSFYYIVFFLNQIWMIDFYDFSRDCLLSFWISFIFLLVRNS